MTENNQSQLSGDADSIGHYRENSVENYVNESLKDSDDTKCSFITLHCVNI